MMSSMTEPKVVHRTDFDRATASVPLEGAPGRFSVDLDAGWSSLVGVHGGYSCALSVRAAEALAPDRRVRTVSASFLRSGAVGPAALAVHEVRRGRSVTTRSSELTQGDHVLNVSRMTLMTEQSGAEWGERWPVDLPPPAACVPFEAPVELKSFRRFELRFDPERMPFHGQRAHIVGYVRPLENRPIDTAWLVMAVDCFPPPAFALVEAPTGGMSVDLTVHIHRSGFVAGDEGWLVGSFEVCDSAGGLAVERGRITTLDGTIVADSFQTRFTARG